VCSNTCAEEAATAAIAAEAWKKVLQEGLAKKQLYKDQAKVALQSKALEKQKAEADLSEKEAKVAELLKTREAMEASELSEKTAFESKMENEKYQHLGLVDLSESQLRELVLKVARQGNNSEIVLETSNEIRSKAGLERVDPIPALRQPKEAEKSQQQADSNPAAATESDSGSEATESDSTVEEETESDLELLAGLLGDGVYSFEHPGAVEARRVHQDAESEKNTAKSTLETLNKEAEADYGPGKIRELCDVLIPGLLFSTAVF
jgi:hypothetical protein